MNVWAEETVQFLSSENRTMHEWHHDILTNEAFYQS